MDRRRRAARTVALMSLFTMADTQTDVPIASFVGDGSDLVSLSVAIEPIQDLHGYDNPWPAGGGANIMDDAYSASYTNEIVLTEGTYYAQAWLIQSPSQHTTNPALLLDGTWTNITLPYSGDGISITGTSFGWLYNNATQIITVDAGKTFTIRYNRNNAAMQTRRLTFSKTQLSAFSPYSNICPISGWTGANIHVSPTTDAADGTTYPIPLGQTVYGGTLDVTTGKLTVDRALIVADGVNVKCTGGYAGGASRIPGINISSQKGDIEKNNLIISSYLAYANYPQDVKNSISMFNSGDWIALHINDIKGHGSGTPYPTDADLQSAANAYLQDNPLQIAYPLATPIVYDLTPTEVNTLLGTNNIWADTGDIKYIEYNI